MQEKTKKTVLGIGVIIVAALFITSYAAFGSNSASSTSTTVTTIPAATTYYVSGNTSASINGYTSQLYLTLTSQNSSVNDTISSLMAKLQDNNTVSNYLNNVNGYDVYLGNATAYSFEQIVNAAVPANSIEVNATAIISLPSVVKMYYRGVGLNVTIPASNYTSTFINPVSIGTKLNVTVFALVTANGSIYNNQLRIEWTGKS